MPKIPSAANKASKKAKEKPTTKRKSSRTSSKVAPKSILKKPKADVPSVDFAELHNESISDEDAPRSTSKKDAEDSGSESFHLQGFSEDEGEASDSSEDDGVVDEIQASDLPTISKDDAVVRKRLEAAKKEKVSA